MVGQAVYQSKASVADGGLRLVHRLPVPLGILLFLAGRVSGSYARGVRGALLAPVGKPCPPRRFGPSDNAQAMLAQC